MENFSLFSFVNRNFQRERMGESGIRRDVQYFNRILLDLAKEKAMYSMSVYQYLRMINEIAAYSLNIERVSMWCFNTKRTKIRCVDQFIRNSGKHSSGRVIRNQDYPVYFSHLEEERVLPITDACRNPITKELMSRYLEPQGIVSMMDVPIRRYGKVMGILCNEQTGLRKKRWNRHEQNYVVSLAEVISNTLEIMHRHSVEAHLQKTNEELRQLNVALKTAKAEADKANSAKSDFLTHMSHEIRTPLGAILGFIQVIKERKVSDGERDQYLSILETNGKKLLTIVNSILDLAKIEANQLDIAAGPFPLKNFLYELFSLLEKTASDRGVKLTLDFSNTIPDVVHTDSVRLYQILMNVVGNAIKFTHKGAVAIRVDVKTDVNEQEALYFKVSDSGIGMTKEQQENIFNHFSQADKSVNRKYGGLGVGLLLSKRLARALGGDVTLLESSPGKGSTFLVKVSSHLGLAERHGERLPAAGSEIDFHDLRVLSVDDSIDMQRLVQVFLSGAGAHIDCASTGEEGVEKALSGDYDAILMDIQMPVMDGYRAVKLLRELGYKKPIVALTAHAMSTEKEKCLNSGFTDYLTKPIDKNLLFSKIRHLLAEPYPGTIHT